MRLIKEFFHPEVKCNRTGHIPEVRRVVIRRRPGMREFRCVVVDAEADITECGRCGALLDGPRNETVREEYSGCSMPKSMWDELRENGFIKMGSA